jgi:hypothetical protein
MNDSFNGKIDPKSIELLSKVLSRTIMPEKADTLSYNLKYVSLMNSPIIQMMEVGMKDSFRPGDGLETTLKGVHYPSILHSRDPVFQFNSYFAFDIGCRYLLRSEADDNFETIFSEIKSLSTQFMRNEDFKIIESAIEAAMPRINNETVMFLSPHPKGICGEHRDMTPSELATYGFSQDTKMNMDVRKDDHDLISLRELAFVMKGGIVDDLSPFASAFLKYMPELNKSGIRALVFEVIDSKLKSIKLSKFKGKDAIPYAPTEAAVAVINCFPELKQHKDLKINTRYYVSVSGFIAAPENKNHFGYTEMTPKLSRAVPAGECVMFNLMEDCWVDDFDDELEAWIYPNTTRLYFYPYKPSDFHPYDQLMTAMCGQSDNMFHSCAYDPESKFYNKEYEEKLLSNDTALDDQPTARYIYVKIIAPAIDYFPPGSLFYPHGKAKFGKLNEDLTNALYGDNLYTAEKYLFFALNKNNMPKDEAAVMETISLGTWYVKSLPAAIRFYEYYKQENSGLGTKCVFTSFHHLKACDATRWTKQLIGNLKNRGQCAAAEKESKETGNAFMNILKRLKKAS